MAQSYFFKRLYLSLQCFCFRLHRLLDLATNKIDCSINQHFKRSLCFSQPEFAVALVAIFFSFFTQYFVPGHSKMEADGMHGNIQRKLKQLVDHSNRIFTPSAPHDVFRTATQTPYKVVELASEDRVDFKQLFDDICRPNAFEGIKPKFGLQFKKVC